VMDAEADGESRLLLVRIRLQGSTNLHASVAEFSVSTNSGL
jgi:hypothetical protein